MNNTLYFDISISDKPITRTEKPLTSTWAGMSYHVENVSVNGLVERLSLGYSHTHVFREREHLTHTTRRNEFWEQTSTIILDFDDRRLTFDKFCDVLETCYNYMYPTIYYPTANDGKNDMGRYRGIYVFETPIYNVELYKELAQRIKNEVDQLTEDRNGNGDRCDITNTTQQFAPFFCDMDRVCYNNWHTFNVEEVKARYGITIPNEKPRPQKAQKPQCAARKRERADEGERMERGARIADRYPIKHGDFLKEFSTLPYRDIVNNWLGRYTNKVCTPLEQNDEDKAYIKIPKDYVEIRRYWYLEEDAARGSKYGTMRKIKDGQGRRRKLFINGVLRRLIDPTLTFDNVLFCLVWEMYHYIVNDGNKIEKKDLISIAENVMDADLSKYEGLKGTKKKFIVNQAYCEKYNITRKQAREIAKRQLNDEQIGELYDALLTDKENLKILQDNGVKCCLRTLKNFKERNGLSNKIKKCK